MEKMYTPIGDFVPAMEAAAEDFSLDEVTAFFAIAKTLSDGTEQEITAIAGIPQNCDEECFFLCNDYYDRLENGVYALDFDRSYYHKPGKTEFLKILKAIRNNDFVTLNKYFTPKEGR